MYISIDRSSARFLHKHEDYQAVCNLDFIENPAAITDVAPVETLVTSLMHWTDLECQLLFRHTTGQEHVPYIGVMLRAVLCELADKFPADNDVVTAETELQAAYVENVPASAMDNTCNFFQYVKGAKIPARISLLFQRVSTVTLPTDQLVNAANKRLASAQHAAKQHTAALLTPKPRTTTSAPLKVVREVTKPRSGVCGQIWDSLDAQILKANGVIPERSFIKSLAVEKGWNPSTASVQYAAWRKQKAS